MRAGRVVQSGIESGGDVAGRDIYNINQQPNRTKLQTLVSKLQREVKQDGDASNFIASLQKWVITKVENPRSLEEKLTDGGRIDLLSTAIEAKESFGKLLVKTTFNASVQEVYACILSLMWTEFRLSVKPLIAQGDRDIEVSERISALCEKIDNELAEMPGWMEIDRQVILGMLFYLTGNCHIDWDRDAPLPSSD